jgi:hypothetical protein
MQTDRIIQEHWAFSENKLQDLSNRIDAVIGKDTYEDLCIMTIGAYGRREANNWSGIDLICIKSGASEDGHVPESSQATIDAALIHILDQLHLPRISPQAYYLEAVLNEPGFPADDRSGCSLTKTFMLTEGAPVYNKNFYDNALRKIVAGYCTDYYKYTTQASAAFIIADITRHWKTIWLKNLHNRKAYIYDWWGHIVNLKLIFNAKLACYSFIFLLLARSSRLTETTLFEIARMKPLERMYRLMEEVPATRTIADSIISQYIGFLTLHNQSIETLKEYFKSESKRREVYHSGEVHFSQKIVNLLQLLTGTDAALLRYLII